MDRPKEGPPVEPGADVSWWDQIAASPGQLTEAEVAAQERAALLRKASDDLTAERAGSEYGATGGHGFERRSERRTASMYPETGPGALGAAPTFADTWQVAPVAADQDLEDADLTDAPAPQPATRLTPAESLPARSHADPWVFEATRGDFAPTAMSPFEIAPPSDTPTTELFDLTPSVRPTGSGRRAAIVAEPDASTEGVRGRAPVHIGPDGRQADPDLIDALSLVLELEASDLHITVGAPPTIRIDGALRPIEGLSAWMPDKVRTALHSIISPADLARFEDDRELDFAYTAAGARFRVNFYHQRNSIGAAFRLIPREIKPLKELGVPESVGKFSLMPRGLVLVTGPTGSGKSTTLAAMVDLANATRPDHIVTVEDPIEFLHKHKKSLVNQREVGHDTKSFAAALKHVLRQDPDIILIGELRDLETISVALTAAETGHLVFATLHTQDAAQTIDRMIDVFPPHQQGQIRTQLAATLRGVVCQTLVKRANHRGRVVATEILVTTPAIANLIREGKTHQIASMMQSGAADGMHTMDQHLAELVDAGQITRQAAIDKAHDVDSLQQLIKRTTSAADISWGTTDDAGQGDNYSTPQR
ncbi:MULTISPECIES: PilT/PilU family type 4a pilus ATPase [unclassified Cryobacterium]|uniref:PilT/PilU family type 4a pilus ATPase n=1 Tax=unclassified Cryobacterium TaxID=2649013 RepID=UPI002AB3F98E|nr:MULTISPECIES: PilT/PilU family type 4a pilus ATPase [unclassified Cryobacterium]MDY7541565.1 PilT/PilU family type 4a pilus ATPase [Cryobacterium sp. 5B3]MEA9998038.1 PilT/PilU family type 4a pilus ATPase [Cryobacterium sp. RTS3]MEB0267649.1 PilT/PilU family type 4a pilus ATPase [Cryobacterium sp. 10I5]MEB0274565.1 PilT/PilU family type 4a pilus ATPase [Cryobacterium sp. 5B3]